MWWLRPVPWFRWVVAALLVGVAIVSDIGQSGSTPYPFAAEAMAAGEAIGDASVEWRDLPIGLLPDPNLEGRLRFDITAGTPLLPAFVDADPIVPEGWWLVDVPLPHGVVAGVAVRIVLLDPPTTVAGIAAGPGVGDAFAGEVRGPVAVPASAADLVARAAAADAVVTLIEAGAPAGTEG